MYKWRIFHDFKFSRSALLDYPRVEWSWRCWRYFPEFCWKWSLWYCTPAEAKWGAETTNWTSSLFTPWINHDKSTKTGTSTRESFQVPLILANHQKLCHWIAACWAPQVAEVQQTWQAFLAHAASQEAVSWCTLERGRFGPTMAHSQGWRNYDPSVWWWIKGPGKMRWTNSE